MLNNTVPEFTKLLENKAKPNISELGLGLRVMSFGGEHLRETCANGKVEEMWIDILRQLPKDVVVAPAGDGNLLQFCKSSDVPFDCYYLYLASSEWEIVKDGGAIPSM